VQCDAHCNSQRKVIKFVLGFLVEHAIPTFNLIVYYERLLFAILVLKPQNVV
jgi:hypothetical protein